MEIIVEMTGGYKIGLANTKGAMILTGEDLAIETMKVVDKPDETTVMSEEDLTEEASGNEERTEVK